jgi:hypothetical protein
MLPMVPAADACVRSRENHWGRPSQLEHLARFLVETAARMRELGVLDAAAGVTMGSQLLFGRGVGSGVIADDGR